MEVMEKYLEFWKEVYFPRKPEWFTNNEVVMDYPAFILRKFSEGKQIVLIVPPQAGHHSSICDYDDEQSLVRTLMALGFSVFVIEWKSCTFERRNEGIEDIVSQFSVAVSGFQKPFILVGLCQGGWLSAICASLAPERITRLIVAGAPIDAKIGGGYIQEMVETYSQPFFENLVYFGGGMMRGKTMLMGWKMMHFAERMEDYWDLWNAIGTDKFEKIKKFRSWYEYTMDLAGKYYLEAVDNIFRKNDLWEGRMILFGKPVDFNNISCPIISIAGEKDDITLPVQALAFPGDHITILNSGHIGIFMGRESQKYWREVFSST